MAELVATQHGESTDKAVHTLHVRRSTFIKGTHNPEWNEKFQVTAYATSFRVVIVCFINPFARKHAHVVRGNDQPA
jgi:hypothetical protein